MLKISKKGDYGLVFLTYLTKQSQEEYISLRSVADHTNVPYKFLSQIALDLKKAKLLISKEGSSGGYRLSKAPEEINLQQIVEALEGPIWQMSCQRGKTCRCADACMHRPTMAHLSATLTQALSRQSLADVVAS